MADDMFLSAFCFFAYLWAGAYFVGQCIRKQCKLWKHWLRGPLTMLEQVMLREKEDEWRVNQGMKPPAKKQGEHVGRITRKCSLILFLGRAHWQTIGTTSLPTAQM
jgi:hypothetical protein